MMAGYWVVLMADLRAGQKVFQMVVKKAGCLVEMMAGYWVVLKAHLKGGQKEFQMAGY